MKRIVLLGFSILFLSSCNSVTKRKYTSGTFPTTPVNFEEMNTEYDDYNSTLSTVGETFPLCFSTTRKSHGGNYDIIYKLITISFSLEDGAFSVSENTSGNLDGFIENGNINLGLHKINTPYDEFGPYLIPIGKRESDSNTNGHVNTYIILYSNNESGNQDIKFTNNITNDAYEDPAPVSFLNSAYDDAYPTFNSDYSEVLFTSNRESKYSIYSVKTDNTKELADILSNNSDHTVEKVSMLSSDYDDKCPFIAGNLLVFASDREGGFGGFDLYYSKLENGEWSEPQNFGEGINSAYDEYRPVVRKEVPFTNDFMLFSSNRPGGLGGFDLYYVGIDKMTE